MRYYIDDEFIDIIEHHKDDIMSKFKEEYGGEVFEIIRDLLMTKASEKELVIRIKDLLIASAELVLEDVQGEG